MSWGQPIALWLLVVPALALLVTVRARPHLPWPALARVSVAGSRIRAVNPDLLQRPWLLWLAVVLAIIALAQPRWGSLDVTVEETAREVIIALDLSRSMLVRDVAPSRIERAHAVVRALLDSLGGERAGVVVFAGGAFVQVPLSSDYQIMREFLPVLRPGYLPQGGSDYAAMLRAVQEGFSEDKEIDRYLVVISDGESTTAGWPAELARLQQRGVQVIALGIGTAAGGDVPPIRASEKSPARSHLEPGTLQKLAAGPRGSYRDASGALDVRALLAETVDQGRRDRQAERESLHQEERFQWFIVAALVAGWLGLWREIAVRPRPRPVHVTQREGDHLPAAMVTLPTALLLLAVSASFVRAHDLADDGEEPTTAIGNLRKLVAHVAAHPKIEVPDLLRIGELTVSYGIESFAKGESVAEGAIVDGLEAVRHGEQMAPGLEQWARLRLDLQRLQLRRTGADPAARPPEQKKEALDEEDRPPQTNGQGSQLTTSESTGQGGVAMSEATIGELRKEALRGELPKAQPRRARANADPAGANDPGKAAANPLRNLLLRRFRQVAKEDNPGVLYQALDGDTRTEPAGGKDW